MSTDTVSSQQIPMLTFCTRETLEKREHLYLSPLATFADQSKGREHPDDLDFHRTIFQQDKDRVLHSKSFRRLSHKTQVFVAPEGDHYRTRLTHTLEVAQISRSIARALGLNEDLTEAIALGHDLGHTPFGHTGEDAISEAIAHHHGLDFSQLENRRLYKHNEQSVRVCRILENEGRGLNLSHEVLDGIRCHTGKTRAMTLEGRIVATADRIAYTNHDIDDAIRAGLLTEHMLPESTHRVLGKDSSERIATMVHDMIEHSKEVEDILMSDEVWAALLELRTFLFRNVYTASDAKREEPKARKLVRALFEYYINHTHEIPAEYHRCAETDLQKVIDYVSGMTDRYAIRTYESLFIPRSWRL